MFSIILSPGAILLSILNFIDAHMLVIDDIKLIFVLVDLKLYRTRNALNYFLVTNPMGVAPTPDKKPSRFVSVVVSDRPDSGSPGPRPGPAWLGRPGPSGSWFTTSTSVAARHLVSVMTAATQHMSWSSALSLPHPYHKSIVHLLYNVSSHYIHTVSFC